MLMMPGDGTVWISPTIVIDETVYQVSVMALETEVVRRTPSGKTCRVVHSNALDAESYSAWVGLRVHVDGETFSWNEDAMKWVLAISNIVPF